MHGMPVWLFELVGKGGRTDLAGPNVSCIGMFRPVCLGPVGRKKKKTFWYPRQIGPASLGLMGKAAPSSRRLAVTEAPGKCGARMPKVVSSVRLGKKMRLVLRKIFRIAEQGKF